MASTIRAVQVLATVAAPGDDAWFVAVHGAGKTGWYGPVSATIGRYAEQTLANAVVGESVTDHDGLYLALHRATADDTTPTASWAVGAVDCAAWDLHGQLAQAPVADLLGDAPVRAVPLYASWLGLDLSLAPVTSTVEPVGRGGWRFSKWSLRARPGDDVDVEASRLAATTRVLARALGGPAAFDAVFTWNVELAARVAKRIDPADVLWLEDPLSDYNGVAYRPLVGTMPLAVGERLLVHADGQVLLDLRPRALILDVVGCGGLTRAAHLVTAATAQGVPVYPHGRSFVPAVHLAAAYPDAVPAVEFRLQWEPVRQQRYAQPWQPTAGTVAVHRSPGLGAVPRSY